MTPREIDGCWSLVALAAITFGTWVLLGIGPALLIFGIVILAIVFAP